MRARALRAFAAIAGGWLVVVGATVACLTPKPSLEAPRERFAVSDGWLALGTVVELDLRVGRDERDRARAWIDAARAEIARLERIVSRHDGTSELADLNRALASPSALRDGARVGPELESVLFSAIEVWEASGGAFEPSVGPLVAVWREAARAGRWPDLARLRAAKRRVGSGALLLPGDGIVGVTRTGMQLDLDGISKGWVLERLRERFLESFPDAAALVSLGESSVLAIGDPDGRGVGGGWRLEARSRDDRGTRLTTVLLRDRALSVSSSVGRLSVIDGEPISHVIDPRTGNALPDTVEAVVVSERADLADGWSTALLVLGAERDAIRLAAQAGVEAYVFESSGRIAATEGWDALEVRDGGR